MLKTTKSLKTPLRYPGGKSRALPSLFRFFPDLSGYREYREPFLGGGSVALEVSKRYPDLPVWVNDLYGPLYDFWVILQQFGDDLAIHLEHFKNNAANPESARELFKISRQILNEPNTGQFERAVRFYIVNKCSFSGLTESSSFSEQASVSNFSLTGIQRLPEYSKLIQKWRITNSPYEFLMDCDSKAFMYLDPPYDIKDNLYGKKGSMHKGFDHEKFCVDCKQNMNMSMCISYNSSNEVKGRFLDQGWTDAEFAHTYTMRSTGSYTMDQAQRKELVLINYEN